MYKYGNKAASVLAGSRRRREKTVEILKLIALGVLLVGTGAAPSPRAISRIFRRLSIKDTKRNRKAIRRKIWEMHHRGYIETSEDRYKLADIGREIIEKEKLWNLKIRKPEKWDRIWHVVVFDIPHEKSKVRIAFIRHLQSLGLVYYQRSVWIHPHEMEDEVRQIAAFHEILPFIAFIKATHVDNSSDLRTYFNLR